MKYLFNDWNRLQRSWKQRPETLWLFDFDGTLTPIVRHPGQAGLVPSIRRLLRQLAERFPGRVGILSGRRLADITQKVGIAALLYGGTHGFEMRGPGWRWRHPLPSKTGARFQKLLREARQKAKGIRGLWVEDKKWTFCVHYRQVPKHLNSKLQSYLTGLCNRSRESGFREQAGLKALEIFSNARWDKGQAVRWLMHHFRVKRVFYVGDDTTDEKVFRVLGSSHIKVRVGASGPSKAAFYLKGQREIQGLLRRILAL